LYLELLEEMERSCTWKREKRVVTGTPGVQRYELYLETLVERDRS